MREAFYEIKVGKFQYNVERKLGLWYPVACG